MKRKNHVSVFNGIRIEDDVFVGANIAFINDRYPRSRNQNWVLEKTTVSKGATLGTNATILCGLEIGEHAFVAAGSVVTKDVPDHALVVGNPAKIIGFVCKCGKKLDDDHECSCGKVYTPSEEGLALNE